MSCGFLSNLYLQRVRGGLFIPLFCCSSSTLHPKNLVFMLFVLRPSDLQIVNKCEVATEEAETNMSRYSLCACEALTVK